jgi:hypothetical protein
LVIRYKGGALPTQLGPLDQWPSDRLLIPVERMWFIFWNVVLREH